MVSFQSHRHNTFKEGAYHEMKAFRASREQLAAAEAQLAERPSADASAAEAPRYLPPAAKSGDNMRHLIFGRVFSSFFAD